MGVSRNLDLTGNGLHIPDPGKFNTPQAYLVANRTFNLELRGLVEEYFQLQQLLTVVRTRIMHDLHCPEQDLHVTLATVGSDGRLEKCMPSLYEVVAYIRKAHNGIHDALHEDIVEDIGDMTSPEAVQTIIQADAQDPLMKTGLFSHVEVKPFSAPNFFAFNGNPNLKAWPSRVIDSLTLGADEGNLIPEAKRKLVSTVQGEAGKKLIALEDDRHKDARKIISRGGMDRFRGQDIRHYDLDAARQLHYGGENGAAALKHGPLRAVQTLCYWKLMQAMRLRPDADALLQATPTPTTDKIPYLAGEGVLKFQQQTQMEELRSLYEYALWWHHRAGYAHHVGGEQSLTLSPNDAAELKENLSTLEARIRETAKKTGS